MTKISDLEEGSSSKQVMLLPRLVEKQPAASRGRLKMMIQDHVIAISPDQVDSSLQINGIISPDEESSSTQIILRYADRFSLPCLAVLFLLAVVLNLSKAGETALLCVRLLFTLFAATYVAVRLLRLQEKEWNWTGWATVWSEAKKCAASAAGYYRRNMSQVIYCAIISLYGTALLFTDGATKGWYVRLVSLLAPPLGVVAKVIEDWRPRERIADSQEQIPGRPAV